MKNYYLLIFLFLTAIFVSCSNDDDAPSSKKMELSQEQAYELVKKNLKGLSLNEVSISVYNEVLPPKTELKRMGGELLVSPAAESWMFFVDEIPLANWGHPCRYIFVDARHHVSVVKDDMPLSITDISEMKKWHVINVPNVSSDYNPSLITPERSASTRAQVSSASMEHYYAVILSGGANAISNYSRYWNNSAYIYEVLAHQYGYDPSKVFVLMSDGKNPALDQNITPIGTPIYSLDDFIYTSSNPDLDGDGIDDVDYAATGANVRSVFSQLASQLTNEDHLFVYTTDHGYFDKTRNESALYLWNEEKFYASDFAQMVKAINAKSINIVMGQCYSGGFIEYFTSSTNVCISTACRKDETSYSMPNGVYDEYLYYWTSSHYNSTADSNGDGYLTAEESHSYAKKLDTRPEHPQHYGGGLLSQRITLSDMFQMPYNNYVDGYCMIDNTRYSFYAGEPNHEPEFGVAYGDRIDVTLTEPDLYMNGTFSWSVVEGQVWTAFFAGNNSRAHLEIGSVGSMGDRIRVKVEANIPIDNYSISQYLNFYITSNYRIAKASEGVLSIERKNPESSAYSLLAEADEFEYQVIDSRTNAIKLSGSYPVVKGLKLDVSHLSSGVYTIVITENKEVQARMNIRL